MATGDVEVPESERETLLPPRPTRTSSVSNIAPGIVLGSYRIVRELGSGAVGRVYLAEHTILGRKVALKMLRSELCHDPTLVRRFFAEARSVNEVAHENIVTITDFVVGEGHPSYFIMELLDGLTLDRLIEEQGALPQDLLIDIAVQLTSALGAAHQKNVVHRDLKPANIFLVPRSTGGYHVRLLDFGVAKFARADVGTAAGTLVGTPDYMAPEQTFGLEIDHRADIYALGAVLYEMATGARPFTRETLKELLLAHRIAPVPAPRQIAPAPISEKLERIILSCLEKLPEDRPQTAEELRALLLDAQEPRKPLARKVVLTAAALIAALGAALVLVDTREEPAIAAPAPPAKILLPPLLLPPQPVAPPVEVVAAPEPPPPADPPARPKVKKKTRPRRTAKKSVAPAPPKKIDRSLTKDPFE